MSLSLLVQMHTENDFSSPAQRNLQAMYSTSSALTLRRLALLSTVERWENSKIQVELLEEVMRRDDPVELGIFLASSHLTKHLSKVGALGHALCEAAEKNLVQATSILACRTSVSERARAALRAASEGVSATFDCLLRSCKSEEEEKAMLESSLLVAANGGHTVLLENIIAGLHCCRVTKLASPAALYCAANRGKSASVSLLVRSFTWSDIDLSMAKGVCERNGVPFERESLVPEGGDLDKVVTLETLAEKDDAQSILARGQYSKQALLSAATNGSASATTALLCFFDQGGDIADLKAAMDVSCEQGNFQTFSRLMQAYKARVGSHKTLVQQTLAHSLIGASRAGRTHLVSRLLTRASEEAIQRSFVHACGNGHISTLSLLVSRCRRRSESEIKDILLAGAVNGRSECVQLVSAAHPEHELYVQELARMGVLRAARLGDLKLAEASASLLTSSTAGGMTTAAVLTAKKHGFDEVVLALKPLKRNVSYFTELHSLPDLNDDVLDRVIGFLDLRSVSRCNQLSKRFSGRTRITDQFLRSLLSDYAAQRLKLSAAIKGDSIPQAAVELVRLAVILSSSTLQPKAYEREVECKAKALRQIIGQAVREEWADLEEVCGNLAVNAADADVAPVVETIILTKDSQDHFVLKGPAVLFMFISTIRKECLKSLSVICKLGISTKRLGTRQLVEKAREESTAGNTPVVSLLLANLAREALISRRERDALFARRRVEWERRGGIWGVAQQEEEANAGKTDEERDFDDAISGALKRAGSYGHSDILSSLLKMLRARGRINEFASDHEKALEGACRGGYDSVISVLFSFVNFPEAVLMDALLTAARNGNSSVARVLVMDGKMPLSSIRSKFVESARRGHVAAVQTLLLTGAIGAATCGDALEEAIRREHEECRVILAQAHQRLAKFEEEEGSMV